jgi:hypothetical protein
VLLQIHRRHRSSACQGHVCRGWSTWWQGPWCSGLAPRPLMWFRRSKKVVAPWKGHELPTTRLICHITVDNTISARKGWIVDAHLYIICTEFCSRDYQLPKTNFIHSHRCSEPYIIYIW